MSHPLCKECCAQTDKHKHYDTLVIALDREEDLNHPLVMYKEHRIASIVVERLSIVRKAPTTIEIWNRIRKHLGKWYQLPEQTYAGGIADSMVKLRIGPRSSISNIVLLPWADNSCAVDCIIELGRHCEYLKIPASSDRTPLQNAFAMTMQLLKDNMSDAELVVAKSPFLFSAREVCGRRPDEPAFLPIASLFEQTFLTPANQDMNLTSVRHQFCDACGEENSHRKAVPAIELYINKNPPTSVQLLIDGTFETKHHQPCLNCDSKEMTDSPAFEVATTVVVDLAWHSYSTTTSPVKINNAINLKTSSIGGNSRGHSEFDLDAGITHRDNHFKAFWREDNGFTLYDGMSPRDARATRVSLIPDSPMLLLYRCHEATSNMVAPRPAASARAPALPITSMITLPTATKKPNPPPAPVVITRELITLVTIIVNGSTVPGRPIISLCRTPETTLMDYLKRVRLHLPPLAGAVAFARGEVVSDLLADEMRALFVDEAGWRALLMAYPEAQKKLWISVEFATTL